MLGWLRRIFTRVAPVSPWRVSVTEGLVVIDDGQGARCELRARSLRRVVVATDDSGPWDADVAFLLYADAAEPVGIFPLEAAGVQDFVRWLEDQPGYRARELSRAMGSTRVARFTVYEAVD